MVGLETRPIAKLNYNRTEGLPTDGKEGRRVGWKQEGANAGMYERLGWHESDDQLNMQRDNKDITQYRHK